MQIKIKSLQLVNFKGLREFTITFNDSITDIFGKNRAGKTTIVDAFNWLLFGKNSIGKTDFEIKTLDDQNNHIHKLEHYVIGEFDVNGTIVNLKRLYKEKWTKKKGEEVAVFNGHETEYYWNDVPMKESEYKAKIDSMINESMFRLLSNTNRFASLDWTEQRECLIQIAGPVNNDSIIDSMATPDNDFGEIINILNQGKSLIEYKKEINAKKKRIKDELELLPSRISEAKLSLPEPTDYASLRSQISVKEASIAEINKQIADVSKLQEKANSDALNTQNELFQKQSMLSKLENNIKTEIESTVNHDRSKVGAIESKIKNLKHELSVIEDGIKSRQSSIDTMLKNAADLTTKANGLREKWTLENAKEFTFDESTCKCPTCKQQLPETDLISQRTTLETNFKSDKQKTLDSINAEGKLLVAQVEEISTKVKTTNSDIEEQKGFAETRRKEIATAENELEQIKSQTNTQIDVATEVKTKLAASMEYIELGKQIESLKEKIANRSTDTSNSELEIKKNEIQTEVNALYSKLGLEAQEQSIKKRITDLEQTFAVQSQELATLERTEFNIDKFNKEKMDRIEKAVNSMFGLVKFKLFETQINGGEKECCKVLIDGVPFSDANTASKINAGLDIIKTLSNHYNISCPIFIDNRESVSEIIPTNSQIVNLFVSPSHSQLTYK